MKRRLFRRCEICYDSAVSKYEAGHYPQELSIMKSIASIFVNLVIGWARAHRLPVVD